MKKNLNFQVTATLIKKDIGNITLFAFDSGQGLSEHTAPFDAVVYILDGQAEITIGEKTSTVNEGEMLILEAHDQDNVTTDLLGEIIPMSFSSLTQDE